MIDVDFTGRISYIFMLFREAEGKARFVIAQANAVT
jgi:hypothetical protein